MDYFFTTWAEAAKTSLGLFWMALWAFAFGYLVSSLIQVLVTKDQMQRTMNGSEGKGVLIGSFFGFISSSCSFAALSTTRALFQKGAGLIPSIAFLLASTNLVIELGFVIAIFLGWQFVAGEYIGGVLLILFSWLLIKLTRPRDLIKSVRNKMGDDEDDHANDDKGWKHVLTSREGWRQIGMKYVMEWQMIWRDVLIGFTVAGLISAFVPDAFFASLFPGSGQNGDTELAFWQIIVQTLVGPLAAFFTFIGSMGNIPLAALLFDHGVSFAGVMAFIFSDLVVLPVLRINAQYYGWKMALYLLGIMLVCLIAAALTMHYGFAAFDALPQSGDSKQISSQNMFKVDYGFFLNLVFIAVSGVLIWFWKQAMKHMHHGGHHHDHGNSENESVTDKIMKIVTMLAIIWLVAGSALIWIV